MISICMASYNGEKYIASQLNSILQQLPADAEVIISDDSSTDLTLKIVEEINDKRIKVFHSHHRNLIKNFENAIAHASGDFIFLTDQDDLWAPDKVQKMMDAFNLGYDIVTHDCVIVNEKKEVVVPSYFDFIDSRKGFVRNMVKRNSYMGCCMAFKATIKSSILPFPEKIPMHDLWIGMIGELKYKTYFLHEKLLFYRQHENNSSFTSSGVSQYSFFNKIEFRLITLYYLAQRFFKILR
jgi:glycosyltransferase involved in cell wall biosynthesis